MPYKYSIEEFKKLLDSKDLVHVLDFLFLLREDAKNNGDLQKADAIAVNGEIITRFMNYNDDYLASDHWADLKKRGLEKHPLCIYCGDRSYTFHHRWYHRVLFKEVLMKDVFPVCLCCHNNFHKSEMKVANKVDMLKLLDTHGENVRKLIPELNTIPPKIHEPENKKY